MTGGELDGSYAHQYYTKDESEKKHLQNVQI